MGVCLSSCVSFHEDPSQGGPLSTGASPLSPFGVTAAQLSPAPARCKPQGFYLHPAHPFMNSP